MKPEDDGQDFNIKTEADAGTNPYGGGEMQGLQSMPGFGGGHQGGFGDNGHAQGQDHERPISIKDDG